MTPDEKNRKLAELLGWTPEGTPDRCPDYCHDLDAVHDAEEELCEEGDIMDGGHFRYRYANALYNITTPLDRQPMRATAEMRVDALILTLEAK